MCLHFFPLAIRDDARYRIKGTAISLRHRSTSLSNNVTREVSLVPVRSDGVFARHRANGIVFEGHGIPPHVFSAPTLENLREDRDVALEIAEAWILSDEGLPPRTQPLPGIVDDSVGQ